MEAKQQDDEISGWAFACSLMDKLEDLTGAQVEHMLTTKKESGLSLVANGKVLMSVELEADFSDTIDTLGSLYIMSLLMQGAEA
jgi:hypothetical protein